MIELVGMTHTGERGTWMNTEIFLQMIVPKITNREVYDFFRKFALNFDDMMEDIIEINKDEDYDTDAMFAVLNNKYKL
jgi:esterase/lipase superfamily enzyme